MYLKKVVPKVYHRKIPTYLFQTLKVDDLPGHLKLSGILCSSAPKPGLSVENFVNFVNKAQARKWAADGGRGGQLQDVTLQATEADGKLD